MDGISDLIGARRCSGGDREGEGDRSGVNFSRLINVSHGSSEIFETIEIFRNG
jgi:hypothetical protein